MSLTRAVNIRAELERAIPLNRTMNGQPLTVRLVRETYDLDWISNGARCMTGESVLLVYADDLTAEHFGLDEVLTPRLLAGGLWWSREHHHWRVTAYTDREAFLNNDAPAAYCPNGRNRVEAVDNLLLHWTARRRSVRAEAEHGPERASQMTDYVPAGNYVWPELDDLRMSGRAIPRYVDPTAMYNRAGRPKRQRPKGVR